jgi:hypothetical protein
MSGAAGTAILLLAACGSRPAGAAQAVHMQPAASASTSTSTPGTITINSIGQTFTPTSGSPALTAAQAYAGFAQLNKWARTAMPGYVTAQLGLLTLPVGPADAPGTSNLTKSGGEAYTALNELAWGFSWKECPIVMPPTPTPGASPAPVPTPKICKAWLFLDANTGHMIDQTWQQ